jgi:hypothetical protein
VAVITGTELTPTELLKIDKTKLHEVVEEELEYEARTGRSKPKEVPAKAAETPEGIPENDGQEGLMVPMLDEGMMAFAGVPGMPVAIPGLPGSLTDFPPLQKLT